MWQCARFPILRPSDVPNSLFTPFFTTKREGLGLGLSISRSIVEAHGGSIVAEASPNGGLLVEVQFPMS